MSDLAADGSSGSVSARVRSSGNWLPGFVVVMASSVVARAVVGLTSSPVVDGDAPGYLQFARLIWHGHAVEFLGKRTPGYSLFLILNGFDPGVVRFAQYALGLAITAGLFFVLWRLTRSALLASIGAALYGLNVGHIYFESTLYGEALATFLLVLALVLLILLRECKGRHLVLLIAVGLTVGALPLVRPLYAYMPLLFALPVFLTVRPRKRRIWAYLLPALIPMVFWMGYVYVNYDYVGLQTVSGFGWSNHAGAFMRDAPDDYAAIRDSYLRVVTARDGQWINAIWPAIPDMQRATGLSYADLSQKVQKLSLELLRSHPGGYARQVAAAFVDFWKGSIYHAVWQPLGRLTFPAWKVTFFIAVIASAWFCLSVVWMAMVFLRTRRLPRLPWPCLWLTAAVLIAAVVQAVVEYGSATRFGMPTFPYVVVVGACVLSSRVLKRPEGAQQAVGGQPGEAGKPEAPLRTTG